MVSCEPNLTRKAILPCSCRSFKTLKHKIIKIKFISHLHTFILYILRFFFNTINQAPNPLHNSYYFHLPKSQWNPLFKIWNWSYPTNQNPFLCFTRVVQFLVDEIVYLCVWALSEYLVSPCKRWSGRSVGYFLMGKRYQEKNWSDCCGFLHLSPKIGQSLWAFCKTLPGKGRKLSRDSVLVSWKFIWVCLDAWSLTLQSRIGIFLHRSRMS